MTQKKESDSICPKPSNESLSNVLLHFSNPCQSFRVKSLLGFNPRKSCAVFILSTLTLVMEHTYSWLDISNVGSSLSLEWEVGFGKANLLLRLVLGFIGVIRVLNSAALATFFLGSVFESIPSRCLFVGPLFS